MFDPSMELEAVLEERFEADMLQADYEQQSREFGRSLRRSAALREEGKLREAAMACPHGGGFPLNSIAASEGTTGFGVDPFAGEDGWRCCDCGSRLSAAPWDNAKLLVPCEVQVKGGVS